MRRQIRAFGVVQTAKVAAAMYFLLGLLVAVPFGLAGLLTPAGSSQPGAPTAGMAWLALLIPFLYAAAGFIAVAVVCLLYNLAAGWLGGIEIELADVEAPAAPRASPGP